MCDLEVAAQAPQLAEKRPLTTAHKPEVEALPWECKTLLHATDFAAGFQEVLAHVWNCPDPKVYPSSSCLSSGSSTCTSGQLVVSDHPALRRAGWGRMVTDSKLAPFQQVVELEQLHQAHTFC